MKYVVVIIMYLNIVNNSFFENRRNKKKEVLLIKDENTQLEDIQKPNTESFGEKTFFSIFYGDLTYNWLDITKN